MKRTTLLMFVYGTLHSLMCLSQSDKKTDSLLMVLKTQKEDTGKVNTLNALSKQSLVTKNISGAKKYAEDALLLAEKKRFKNGITNAYINIGNTYTQQGNTYYYQGNHPEALKNYLAALNIFEKNEFKKGEVFKIYPFNSLI